MKKVVNLLMLLTFLSLAACASKKVAESSDVSTGPTNEWVEEEFPGINMMPDSTCSEYMGTMCVSPLKPVAELPDEKCALYENGKCIAPILR